MHKVPRVRYAALVALLGLAAVAWRVTDLAVLKHERYARQAELQAANAGDAPRGSIRMADGPGRTLVTAADLLLPAVIVVPSQIPAGDEDRVAADIAAAAGIDSASLAAVLKTRTASSRTVARRLTNAQADAVRELAITGVDVAGVRERVYPAGMLAADVIGFFGQTAEGASGRYGVEAGSDGLLTGAPASASDAEALGRLALVAGLEGGGPQSALDVELTLDRGIQAFAEEALAKAVDRYHAAGGVIIVQEPSTGRILAMADSPSFDPNRYGSFPVGNFVNAAVQTAFEPGSSFKPFTMALALEHELVTPSTMFNDIGDVVVDGYTIRNYNEGHFGRVSMTTVLEKSINTGTMHVQGLLGNDRFLSGIVDFGFGQRSGVDLPSEAPGSLDNLATGRRINFLTASFGQGITVTPLQLAAGYSAIANEGKLMRPQIIAATVDARGVRTEVPPRVAGTPITPKTARTLTDMLVSVVDRGFDKARIPRYDIAGKTGTAQIASPEGGYLEKEYTHTFAGFAPASDPRFTIVIKLDRPQGITFAADSLSPVFRDIAAFLLNYLNVPPTR